MESRSPPDEDVEVPSISTWLSGILGRVNRKLASWTIAGLLVAGPRQVAGQDAAPAPPSAGALPDRPGLFRLGGLYLTPYLHVGAIGLDSNVFYAPSERRTDFTASGGPGLEVVRPFGRGSRLRLDGGLDYLWFRKTASQRKLNGYGSAQLELVGVKTRLTAEERYDRTFSRPDYQVNARVQQESEGTRGLLTRRLGERFQLAAFGSRLKTTTDSQSYLGTDLGQTLTQDRYDAGGELRTALSIKTQFVAGGEQDWYRFPLLRERDGDSTLAYGGLRTDGSALIAGRAVAGFRWFRLASGGTRNVVYADVTATWNISPKTKIGGAYRRDLDYSAFSTAGATPTNLAETAELSFDKLLTRTVYLRLSGRVGQLASDGAITVVSPIDGAVSGLRDDRIREASAELGYQFRSRVRMGVTATYTNRTSYFETFGIKGLLAGFTVKYTPPQPTFR